MNLNSKKEDNTLSSVQMEAIINERKINNIQIESYSWIIKTYHFVNDYKWQKIKTEKMNALQFIPKSSLQDRHWCHIFVNL